MSIVETVRGPIDTGTLGQVLAPEQVFAGGAVSRRDQPGNCDEETWISGAVEKLTALKDRGIDTILDPTVIRLGRHLPRLQRVNSLVDINILAATGVYTYNDVPFHFHFAGPGLLFGQPEPMVELFLKEIREGIADTGVKPALLTCSIEETGLTPGVEWVVRAVGAAHVETGRKIPITVYTSLASTSGLDAQRVFKEEGVDLSKVVIGHVGKSIDLDTMCAIADAGSLLGLDRLGVGSLLPVEARVDTIVEMVRRGYAEKIVLAHGTSADIDLVDRADAGGKRAEGCTGGDVLPALRERGVSDDDIRTMLVCNPRRYFE